MHISIKPIRAIKKTALLLSRRTAATRHRGQKSARSRHGGYNLMELLLLVAVIGALAMVAYPSYTQYVDRSNNVVAATFIESIAQSIERFHTIFDRYPDSLAEIALDGMRDPWGNPFQYLRIQGGNLKGKGKLRKDKSLVPVNSDFDLYSMGKDGASVPPFTAKQSRDDIVRANNGGFIGLAADY